MPRDLDCQKCILSKSVRTVCVWGERGAPFDYKAEVKPDILLLGEAPGADEDVAGRPFIGRSGQALRTVLNQLGLLQRSYITNAVKCRPPSNATPNSHQVSECSAFWQEEIRQLQPKFIVALGATAIRALTGDRIVQVAVFRNRRNWSYQGIPIIATYHPAAAVRDPKRWPSIVDDLHRILDRETVHPEDVTIVASNGRYPRMYAFDLETSMLNPFHPQSRILCAATSSRDLEAISYPNPLDFAHRIEQNHTLIGHGVKFDLLWLLNKFDYRHKGAIYDTSVMAHLLDENLPSLSLKYLATQHTGLTPYDRDILEKRKRQDLESVPLQDLLAYNAKDAAASWMLYRRLSPEIKKLGLERLVRAQGRVINCLVRMEARGLPISPPRLRKYALELTQQVRSTELRFREEFDLNLNSTRQLIRLCVDSWGLPVLDRTPKGRPCVTKEVLEQWRGLCSEDIRGWLNIILDYRKKQKILSTYLTNIEEGMDRHHRVHASYNITGTVTGRMSCNSPNLQNFPRDEHGPKQVVLAPLGWNLIQADYSQIELRIGAILAQDKTMLDMFLQGADIHTATAKLIYKKDPTKEERSLTKRVNFGILYGISPGKLAEETGMDLPAATKFIGRWFATFPDMKKWLEETARDVLSAGYVSSMFGRRRHLPRFVSSKVEEARAIRQATNFPIQSSAGELTLLAMTLLQERLEMEGLGYVIANVHDSVLVECPVEKTERVVTMIREVMEDPTNLCSDFGFSLKFPIPITAEIKAGKDWSSI